MLCTKRDVHGRFIPIVVNADMRFSHSLNLTLLRPFLGITSRPIFLSRQPFTQHGFSRMAVHALPQQSTASAIQLDGSNETRETHSLQTLALSPNEDNSEVRENYRPFILSEDAAEDWVESLELTTALKLAESNLRLTNQRLKVLVLYGSLRSRSYSRLVAFEASRILFRLGCDVRVFDPEGLPVKNDRDHNHAKVQELRELSNWSDGHLWVSPEQHGNLVSTTPTFIPNYSIKYINDASPLLDRSVQEPD
jgi:arsenic resistance protein ArsH